MLAKSVGRHIRCCVPINRRRSAVMEVLDTCRSERSSSQSSLDGFEQIGNQEWLCYDCIDARSQRAIDLTFADICGDGDNLDMLCQFAGFF
jgi:hypothetical protein